jgi:cystathionine gamma-lyase
LCLDDVYGGTNRLFRKIVSKSNIDFSFVDLTNLENVAKNIKSNTKLVWVETPSNPTMKLIDIKNLCLIVKEINKDILILVDNTFVTSYFQTPLDLGADIVLHSLTKYMNGHGDVVMGALIVKEKSLAQRLQFLQYAGGAVPSPFDCYLTLRGLRTLAVRMKQHMINGLAVARFLESHPQVERVIHPGLKSHPQYELGIRQMKGFSGMVTCYFKADREQTNKFVSSLKIFLWLKV